MPRQIVRAAAMVPFRSASSSRRKTPRKDFGAQGFHCGYRRGVIDQPTNAVGALCAHYFLLGFTFFAGARVYALSPT
jgi:hypothetical protein